MKPKTKFEIIAGIVQSIIGFIMVFSFINWRLEALYSVDSSKYQFWLITHLISAVILFINAVVFKLLEYKYFPKI